MVGHGGSEVERHRAFCLQASLLEALAARPSRRTLDRGAQPTRTLSPNGAAVSASAPTAAASTIARMKRRCSGGHGRASERARERASARASERATERDRETETEPDRQTERQRDRETVREEEERERQKERERQRQCLRHRERVSPIMRGAAEARL